MQNHFFGILYFSLRFYFKLSIYIFFFALIINYFFYYLPKLYDFPLTLNDPYSVYAYGLIETHNSVMWFIFLILIFVYWVLIQFLRESIWNRFYKKLGIVNFFNTSDLYSLFEFILIFFYLKIWSVFIYFWRRICEFFFLNFFYSDFIEIYTWIEWVPDIFRTVCDYFYSDFFTYIVYFNKKMHFINVIHFFFLERKLLLTYCNNINNYYLYSKNTHKDMYKNLAFRHSGFLEFIFAFFPSLIIIFILVPSLHLLYASEDAIIEPEYTIKIMGHQWYWTYEFNHIILNNNNEFVKLTFDITQNIKIESDLEEGENRLLEVDNYVPFPIGTPLRLLISSADVLHSWSMAPFGIKVDAVPGRLNAINTFIFAPGTFYGQCSELCGVGHGFMPIKVKAVSIAEFLAFAEVKEPEVKEPEVKELVNEPLFKESTIFQEKNIYENMKNKSNKIINKSNDLWYTLYLNLDNNYQDIDLSESKLKEVFKDCKDYNIYSNNLKNLPEDINPWLIGKLDKPKTVHDILKVKKSI